ncbi:hypothetical protein ACFWIO_06080 [Streptomyces diastatochromogenes]|uniref:aromatic-ring hydroxylase C-terminal domain-containing protein n=1 Tax=Streptomyces diastatochromogenes TaxID=42236 RepID=UPI00364C1E1C
MPATAETVPVLVVGAGPVGLTPAMELEHHGWALAAVLQGWWTPGLLRRDHDVTALTEAAAERDVPLGVVDVRDTHARALYERDLVLVRPDQHVAWRGDTPPADPHYVVDPVRGAHH